jgi:hypothetical protein
MGIVSVLKRGAFVMEVKKLVATLMVVLQLQIANRDQLHRSLQKNISAEIVTCC